MDATKDIELIGDLIDLDVRPLTEISAIARVARQNVNSLLKTGQKRFMSDAKRAALLRALGRSENFSCAVHVAIWAPENAEILWRVLTDLPLAEKEHLGRRLSAHELRPASDAIVAGGVPGVYALRGVARFRAILRCSLAATPQIREGLTSRFNEPEVHVLPDRAFAQLRACSSMSTDEFDKMLKIQRDVEWLEVVEAFRAAGVEAVSAASMMLAALDKVSLSKKVRRNLAKQVENAQTSLARQRTQK